MKLFRALVIETHSYCNRRCKTCLRQTYPDRLALAGRWPEDIRTSWLPDDVVCRLIDEAAEMGFRGWLCLQDFNEPLFDERIVAFAKYAKSKKVFREIYANTNGDMLDEELAKQLDGAFDSLHISLYGGRDSQKERKAKYPSWFEKTKLTWGGSHVVTHYSPFPNLQKCIDTYLDYPCIHEVQKRMIISYTGKMLLCCEDIGSVWDLGNVYESSLKDLWFSPRHTEIVETLAVSGGRRNYSYCSICPRISPQGG